MPTIADNIVAKAISHVGAHEEPMGSNSGPFVDRCLAYVGLPSGNPWCAAFASLVVGSVLTEMGLSEPHPCTGSSGAIVQWGRLREKVQVPVLAQPGDFAMVPDVNSPTGYRHTTILRRPIQGTVWETIEGNEGDRVTLNRRDLAGMVTVRPY